jgi:hypothetical protein
LSRNIGVTFTEGRFTQGHPLHLNLLAIRGSDLRAITHASSGAESFLIGRVRLPEFFDACGATNRRYCGQNLCLQTYEVHASMVSSVFFYCLHFPFLTGICAHGDDLRQSVVSPGTTRTTS